MRVQMNYFSDFKQMNEDTKTLIKIEGAYKRYSSDNVILRGLNMTVEKGTIYGLLGPSGCGKTTLLSCIAGYVSLDAGSVTVKLDSKKQLGYMPQDIALMELFTVSEMLKYFGKVHGMSSSTIKERGKMLLQLMQLSPDTYWKRVIGSLSGGQQRRISLTVALLHDPILLILDEPTVGLDPLINERIWQYFVDVTDMEGKTLIITTHYIEEARRAHMIGLMRNGILLAEDPPMKLLLDHKCDALEDVFLLLSQKQSIVCEENEESYPKERSSKPPIVGGSFLDYKSMGAQIYKNMCWVKRNIPVLLFMLILPAFMMYLFCTVYSDSLHGIYIAVVAEDRLPDSCQNPTDPAMVNQTTSFCRPQSIISCQYVKMIRNKNYEMKEYNSFEPAYDAFILGEAHAILHFQKNFSWAMIRRISEGVNTPDRYINASVINVYIDRSELTIGMKIEKDLRESVHDLEKLITVDCGYNARSADSALKFDEPIYGERSPKFTHTAMPGFIIPVAFYFTTFFSASALGGEKFSGFLQRCLISGVHHSEVVLAHTFTQVILVAGQNFMLLSIAYGVYDLPLKGSWALVITFIALAEIQGMFYGFFLGKAFDEEKNISYCAVGTVICLFLSCGMFWPLEGAHWIIYNLQRFSPLVMAVESYRSVTIRGLGLSHPYITISIFANIGLVLFFLALFVLVSKTEIISFPFKFTHNKIAVLSL